MNYKSGIGYLDYDWLLSEREKLKLAERKASEENLTTIMIAIEAKIDMIHKITNKLDPIECYPVLIIRNDDKEEFIHLGYGLYRTKWGVMNGSISTIHLDSFNRKDFTFYFI